MNSLVTLLSDTSVMSSSCFEMRFSSRSNGPSKFDSETRKPASVLGVAEPADAAVSTSIEPSGDGATGDQLPRQSQVGLGGCVLRRELGDGNTRHRGVGELHGAADHGLEDVVAERLDDPLE